MMEKTDINRKFMDDFFTYCGHCMGFPELVEGSIEEGHSKDESKICEVDKNSSRSPNRT